MSVRHWLQIALFIAGVTAHGQTESEDAWPRKFSANGKDITIYQPQVENWQGTNLEERAAVAIETKAAPEPVFGVIWIKSRTDIDKSQRLVARQDIRVTKANFPTEPNKAEELRQLIEKNSSSVLGTISLDRLRASLTITAAEAKHRADGLKNDNPEIFYSDQPAVLVLIDGPAVLRDTGMENLFRVMNSRTLIVLDKGYGQYYLMVGSKWYTNSSLHGYWKPAAALDPALSTNLRKIRVDAEKNNAIETVESTGSAPMVFSSMTPAELIQTKGPAQMEPIAATQLLYVTNTPDNVFFYVGDQNYYVNLSGRWFHSKKLNGPWEFVASEKLPGDFAKIPETHPKGEILASVPGTPDAQEAAIANEIPQTATVDRKQAKLAVTYDGDPQFVPITNSPLQYASNSATPVIRMSDGSYYAVENGVWFTGSTPQGPWTVATVVPDAIYRIPPSVPVYNVSYVYIYGADPNYVYVGYLPGYLGSYVTPSGVVVYGTGYYYPPWCGHYWYGYPVTYGYGISWGFGFGWAFHPPFWGAPVYHPWWGPWHSWNRFGGPVVLPHFTVNHFNVYHNADRGWVRPTAIRSMPHSFSGGQRANNVFVDHSGNIYRHDGKQWQQYNETHQWQPVHSESAAAHASPAAPHFNGTQELDRERFARQRGESRTVRYQPPPAAVKKRTGR